MNRSLYWKITIPFVLLVLIGMGALGFYTVNTVRDDRLEHLRTSLINEARLVATDSVSVLKGTDSGANADSIAKNIGQEIDARVTIIGRDGTVLGDSWEDPQTLENHATRPEVAAALSSEVGESTRYSTTTGRNMLYIAVPIVDQGKLLGAARVALATTDVERSVGAVIRTIIWATVIVTLLVVLAAALIARMITRPLRQMTRAAMSISSGQFDKKIELRTEDELGLLGQTFNKMSANLMETVNSISDERSKLATVLSSMADGVIMTDVKTRVVLANTAAENLFNFQESKVKGKALIEVVINYEINNLLEKCLETNRKQSAFVDTTSGRFLMVIAAGVRNNQIPGALLLFQDLTELRSLQTMRRLFVGNITHELRTPLAGIKAVIETLRDGAIEDKAVALDFLNKMNSEVDSMTQLINELIELSRIESGQTKLRLEALNLNDLIKEVFARLAPQAERKQLIMQSELYDGLPAVQADRERISQVITNIVHNAIKFTPDKGKITAFTGVSDGAVNVRISDTGIGISKEDLPHIFERFFKADKSRTSEGSGLGLAIARHIVRAHGGTIQVRSEEGRGATFSFSLPVK